MLFTRPVQPAQLQQQLNAERTQAPCLQAWFEEERQAPTAAAAPAMKIEAHPSKLFVRNTSGEFSHG